MRSVCERCRRPTAFCYCALLPSLETRTRVVFLQHPRERRVPVSTCRMAHLALPNSELHIGIHFDALVGSLVARDDVALLFPSDEAESSNADAPPLDRAPPGTLVVIDGTWTQARKVFARNPGLKGVRRIGLRPLVPGNYRIRREPSPHCLSTIEAVVAALGQLEEEPLRFRGMLRAFDFMVERQLEHAHAHLASSRRRRRSPTSGVPPWLPEGAVLVAAEANAPSPDALERFEPELVQLLAVRVATGERFSSLARPSHPLSEGTPRHLDLAREALLGAPPRSDVVQEFLAFLRPGDALAAWGTSTPTLLRRAGIPLPPACDVRLLWRRRRKGRTGGVEDAARWLGAEIGAPPEGEGRGGRRLAALHALARAAAG